MPSLRQAAAAGCLAVSAICIAASIYAGVDLSWINLRLLLGQALFLTFALGLLANYLHSAWQQRQGAVVLQPAASTLVKLAGLPAVPAAPAPHDGNASDGVAAWATERDRQSAASIKPHQAMLAAAASSQEAAAVLRRRWWQPPAGQSPRAAGGRGMSHEEARRAAWAKAQQELQEAAEQQAALERQQVAAEGARKLEEARRLAAARADSLQRAREAEQRARQQQEVEQLSLAHHLEAERQAAAARRRLIDEQDAEYQRGLERDRELAVRRAELDGHQQHAADEAARLRREHAEQLHATWRHLRRAVNAESAVVDGISHVEVAVKLPNSRVARHRFAREDDVGQLRAWVQLLLLEALLQAELSRGALDDLIANDNAGDDAVAVAMLQGVDISKACRWQVDGEWEVLTVYPRQQVPRQGVSFEEAGLRQAMMVVEQRHC